MHRWPSACRRLARSRFRAGAGPRSRRTAWRDASRSCLSSRSDQLQAAGSDSPLGTTAASTGRWLPGRATLISPCMPTVTRSCLHPTRGAPMNTLCPRSTSPRAPQGDRQAAASAAAAAQDRCRGVPCRSLASALPRSLTGTKPFRAPPHPPAPRSQGERNTSWCCICSCQVRRAQHRTAHDAPPPICSNATASRLAMRGRCALPSTDSCLSGTSIACRRARACRASRCGTRPRRCSWMSRSTTPAAPRLLATPRAHGSTPTTQPRSAT